MAAGFDWQKVTESKRALRERLAAAPIAEKLRMLDALRQRAVTIRTSAIGQSVSARETPTHHKSTPCSRGT